MNEPEDPIERREPGEPPGPPPPGPPTEVPPVPEGPPPGPNEAPLPTEVPPPTPQGPGLPGGARAGAGEPPSEAEPRPPGEGPGSPGPREDVSGREPTPAPAPRSHAEPSEVPVEVPRGRLRAQTRRDFILFGAGVAATAIGGWWLAPDETRARLLPGGRAAALDSTCARFGLSPASRERALDRAIELDDGLAAALFSRHRPVRAYDRSQVTFLKNNYNGQTPGPEYLAGWSLRLRGLASGREERLPLERVLALPRREQVTRLVCVEGWSAVAWWRGVRFADLLEAWPPAAGARWASLRSDVNLDGNGRPDPYYVSIDLETARHPQTLLATELDGRPLGVEHGAPLRLLAPMKLGLKNIKAITAIEYGADEPPDYWHERGYSAYDGL